MAFTFPLTVEVHEEPTIFFGPGSSLQERYDDEEVQGGKIALIAVKRMRAQKPPNGLDRMQSTFVKQIAYNQRIMEAESEISGINVDAPHFLSEMNAEERVIVCVNSSEEMHRGESAMAGQLWIQGDRRLTASNKAFPGMPDTRQSALLSGLAEAVSWRHAGETAEHRKGQRIVIYPKELGQVEPVLSAGDPNMDPEHSIAFTTILQCAPQYEEPPTFLKEDVAQSCEDPIISQNVSELMAVTKQVATGNRRRTAENGADMMNSSDDDDPDMKPDELTGMYTAGMDPEKGPVKLTEAQVAAQKAAARAPKPQPPRVESPPSEGSSNDDDPFGPKRVWSMSKGIYRPNKKWIDPDTLALPAPDASTSDPTNEGTRGNPVVSSSPAPQASRFTQSPLALPAPTAHSSDDDDPDGPPFVWSKSLQKKRRNKWHRPTLTVDEKAAAPPSAPAEVPTKEQKAPKRPVKGRESPGTKVPTPTMVTRSQASRAGGLRPGGGSGSKDTCVAKGNPSKT
jgi:hypothetical protein